MNQQLLNSTRSANKGLTLIELMIGLVVGSIVLAVGVPSYRSSIANQTRVTAVNEFVTAMNLARSHAVKTSKHVTVCRSTNSDSCATGTGDWSDGWIVFSNTAQANVASRSDDEELLRVFSPIDGAGSFSASGALSGYVSFRPTGDTDVSGTWVYCDERGANAARAVVLYRSGRAQVSDMMIDGTAISCGGGSD